MSDFSYQVGDRVEYVYDRPTLCGAVKGDVGTVGGVLPDVKICHITWDKGGHSSIYDFKFQRTGGPW